MPGRDEICDVRVEPRGGGWVLAGAGAAGFGLVNDYLGYLADRRDSPRTIRAYAYDLLHLVRWLPGECLRLEQVTTEVLLRYLTACRTQTQPDRPGRRGDNVFLLRDGRNAGLAPATINRRLAAISGLFAYRTMRDPDTPNPVPAGRQVRVAARAERAGLLGHLARPKPPLQAAGAPAPPAAPRPGPARGRRAAAQLPQRA